MIYILSDDRFFSSGLYHIFSAKNKEICVIESNVIERYRLLLTEDDIVFVAIEETEVLKNWLRKMLGFRSRVVIFVNVDMPARVNFYCDCKIISKKISANVLLRILSGKKNKENARYAPLLSKRETDILTLFSGGWNAYQIATRLQICDKAVSLHKKHALQKLGLNHLTAQSVLIYANVYRNIECSAGMRRNEGVFR
ncbi:MULTISPECIES: LuxR C-terminal-related transcriptional regulator [Enterobacterales]|uniref:LuxR C-terminal-related transcriptional regulator n=1 Tax=Enterobacterales TaxID=91347 RepID=UPI002EDAA9C3